MTVLMCSDTLRLLVMVTPRIFTVVVRSMPGIGGGGCTHIFRRFSKKATLEYVVVFTFRLLALAHASPLDSSACLLLAFTAGMIMYVSSANFTIWLPCVTGLKSAAFTIYASRPMPEPLIMLEDISLER